MSNNNEIYKKTGLSPSMNMLSVERFFSDRQEAKQSVLEYLEALQEDDGTPEYYVAFIISKGVVRYYAFSGEETYAKGKIRFSTEDALKIVGRLYDAYAPHAPYILVVEQKSGQYRAVPSAEMEPLGPFLDARGASLLAAIPLALGTAVTALDAYQIVRRMRRN